MVPVGHVALSGSPEARLGPLKVENHGGTGGDGCDGKEMAIMVMVCDGRVLMSFDDDVHDHDDGSGDRVVMMIVMRMRLQGYPSLVIFLVQRISPTSSH